MESTFITQREKTTFEKKVLEVMGDGQERKIYNSGFSPHLIQKNTELENIQAELQQVLRDQEKWDGIADSEQIRLNEKRMRFEQEEKQEQEKIRRMKVEIKRYTEEFKRQQEITKRYEDEYQELVIKENSLQETISQFKGEIEELQSYADFFDKVVTEGSMFGTTDNILNRYKALKAARADCSNDLQSIIRDIHPMNYELAKERDKLLNDKIETAHMVAQTKEEINKLQKQNRYVQMNIMKDAERVEEKESDYVTIMSSIDNITQRVLSTQNKLGRIYSTAAEGTALTVEMKLDLIEKRFQDLIAIVDPESFQEMRKDKTVKPKTAYGRRLPTGYNTPKTRLSGKETPRRNEKENSINEELQNAE